MQWMIITDLEGPSGVDSFEQTRTNDMERKHKAMESLTAETNACIEGILTAAPGSVIDALDGHGTGGLLRGKLLNARFIAGDSNRPYYRIGGYDGLFFVGQHAMAGTYAAPLCHTYSSLNIVYYRLNGVFVGEFAARALVAGHQDVPCIFLSGDDKAVCEAKSFIPAIETVTTKIGLGIEEAYHYDSIEVCRMIREGAARAIERAGDIQAFVGFEAPYTFEARFVNPIDLDWVKQQPRAKLLDAYTYQIVTDDLADLPF
jgi:D-amino peptidase